MLRPLGFRVLIKPDVIEEKTKSGLVLAIDTDIEKNARITGVVVAIGPDAFKAFKPSWVQVEDWKPWVEVGERVYYARYAGKTIIDRDTNEEFVVLNDEDLVVAG